MKIIKNSPSLDKKCEFGDFEILPEEGWGISEVYKDFESGLLVVRLSDKDEKNWENLGYGGRRIPTKQFIVQLETLEILSPDEWKKYFNYEKVVFQTTDNKYKLTTQRIHEPEGNTDSIKEELEFLETGLKSSSVGVAFRKEKRENLLENLYRSIQEKAEKQRILDAKLTLEEFYKKQLGKLKESQVVMGYFSETDTFKLSFSNSTFVLEKSGKLLAGADAWKIMQFEVMRSYSSLEEFWRDFANDGKWFLKYSIHYGISEHLFLLAKHIIHYFNGLREKHQFTFDQYHKINQWENAVWSEDYKPTEIKQWCSNCYKEVYFQARYPKYICNECYSKEKLDAKGNLLEFSNLGFSGGFKITRKSKTGEIIEEDDTQYSCDCWIDHQLFFAEEAKFGGIVIQRKE